MHQSALVLLPPAIVLLSAVLTRKLHLSLFFGLISATFIAQNGSLFPAGKLFFERLFEQVRDKESLFIYLFLFCVGILICIINRTGGVTALAHILKNRISNKKLVKHISICFSALFAIDDYLSSLTVGHVLRPLTDHYGIARQKLAYIVHAFAAPLVILLPISTWGAFITAQIEQTGIPAKLYPAPDNGMSAFFIFLQTIPFIYYALLTLFTAFYIVNRSISYGPMHRYEVITAAEPKTATYAVAKSENSSLADLLVPICTLLSCVIFGLLYMGNCYLFGGTESISCSLQQNHNAFQVLGLSGIATITVGFLQALYKKQIPCHDIPTIVAEGITLMGPVILLVIAASALGSVLRADLQTGHYLARHLLDTLPVAYLPFIFFIAGALSSSLIGIGWGSIALLLPIAIPMAWDMAHMLQGISSLALIVPTIGAVLAGSIFGDQTSPMAAACEIAAQSSGCSTKEHVRTQYPYAIPPFIGAAIAYLVTGSMLHYPMHIIAFVGLIVGVAVTIALLSCLSLFYRKAA